jgi:N-acetylmuramic acid 6-phosphate (MurNAc-6-P) etherase
MNFNEAVRLIRLHLKRSAQNRDSQISDEQLRVFLGLSDQEYRDLTAAAGSSPYRIRTDQSAQLSGALAIAICSALFAVGLVSIGTRTHHESDSVRIRAISASSTTPFAIKRVTDAGHEPPLLTPLAPLREVPCVECAANPRFNAQITIQTPEVQFELNEI